MAPEARYRRRDLPFQEIQGQAVIVSPERRELHELDETGTFLWSRLSAEATAGELAAALCEEFEVDEATASKDVRDFLAMLEDRQLVSRR